MVSVENLKVEFGGFTLLNSISFVINKKDRIALIGKNGAGKSTLLKILAGLQTPGEGRLGISKETLIAYLPQVMTCPDNCSVIQEAEKAFAHIIKLQKDIERIQQQLIEREDYESEEYHRLIEKLDQKSQILSMTDAGNYKAEIEKTLLGLGFERSDFDRPTGEFSGGWRMRIELAKLLLQKPDLLLLDEPTNHLDIESIQWLENFLAQNSKAVIVVSHDRAFLDAVCTRTIELSLGKIYDFKLPYSRFVEFRKEMREQQMRSYENQQKLIQDTEAFIERFRYKATKAVQVQSRIKQLEKIERIEVDEQDNAHLHLRFPPAPHSGSFPVIIEQLSKSYGEHLVIGDVQLSLRRGEKVAFVGRNGEGKSTLVKCILDEIPYEGSIKLGHKVKIAYFAQNQPQLLDENLSVFETVDRVATGDVRTKIRDILGAFMFGGEASDKKVRVLSGGERSRLAMIRLLLEPANLLILDEPTNHLDMPSKDILKAAIKTFDGTVILVSHDREFLDGLVEKVYEFGHQKVREHLGDIRQFLEKKKLESLRQLEQNPLNSVTDKDKTSTEAIALDALSATNNKEKQARSKTSDTAVASNNYAERKALNRKIKKLEKMVQEREDEVSKLEKQLELTQNELNTPEGAGRPELHEQYIRDKKALDNALSYWEMAATEMESFKNN
ncbi:MAG: ABC-F family ATP-binding cassette domain-containing protein [Bacteroidales bacterium]|nr:ABC-F family ATP-binding cassette domain-containing protein [Bacteroidales bacterium]